MISYNKDASGQKLRVNFNENISAATAFAMTLEPTVGEKLEVTPTLGTSNVVVGDETFLANEYVEYAVTADMFDYVGRWRAKAEATVSPGEVATDYRFFRVMG
jgi:hypothetical protein